MAEAHLSASAHFLLWGFPLLMVVIAVVAAIRGRGAKGGAE